MHASGPAEEGLIPIRIGITGHRDLVPDGIESIEREVERILRSIRHDHPNSPIEVLSALAEGADRVAARVAIREGARLIVPLPMQEARYVTDFRDEESRREYYALAAQARRRFVIPEGGEGEREAAYTRLGLWLARQSHVLIAIWTGTESGKRGGTADVVRFRLEGPPEELADESLLFGASTGPVHHVVAPRTSEPFTTLQAYTTVVLQPSRSDLNDGTLFSALLSRTDEFNRDVRHASVRTREAARGARVTLCTSPEAEAGALHATAEMFGWSDALAIHFQGRTTRLLTLLYVMVFIAVVAFELFAHRIYDHYAVLGLYLALLAAAFATHRLSSHGRHQDKRLDYRALAEGLRVQYYWQVAGVRAAAADYYLRQQRADLEWIRAALRGCSDDAFGAPQEHTVSEAGTRRALQEWVGGQSRYFAVTVNRYREQLERLEHLMRFLVMAGLAAALILFLTFAAAGLSLHVAHAIVHWLEETPPFHGVALLSITLPAVGAALLHAYLERKALASHVKRYAHAMATYEEVRRRIEHAATAGDHQRAQALFHQLGREALQENGDWVVVVRDRPLRVPHPA